MTRIAPSLLAADFSDLREQIALVEKGGADWLHLDVMDGHFVPNITIGPPVIAAIRKHSRLPFDVHLMIEEPDRYLQAFREAGADRLIVHYEACRHLHRTVQRIRELGAAAGVSLNPATPVETLTDILQDVDQVLVMTVNPGFGGQVFIPRSLDRVRRLAAMLRSRSLAVEIEVDGGIDQATAGPICAAGATVLVAGTHVFRAADIPGAIAGLRRASIP